MGYLIRILLLKNRQEYNYRFINHFLENSVNLNLFISNGSKKKKLPSRSNLIKKNKKIINGVDFFLKKI